MTSFTPPRKNALVSRLNISLRSQLARGLSAKFLSNWRNKISELFFCEMSLLRVFYLYAEISPTR